MSITFSPVVKTGVADSPLRNELWSGVWIGDPCYLLSGQPEPWHQFIDSIQPATLSPDAVWYVGIGPGLLEGMLLMSTANDGTYPVFLGDEKRGEFDVDSGLYCVMSLDTAITLARAHPSGVVQLLTGTVASLDRRSMVRIPKPGVLQIGQWTMDTDSFIASPSSAPALWSVTSEHDGNEAFEVEAVDRQSAAIAALNTLGWNVSKLRT
jgi:hypothetical protein